MSDLPKRNSQGHYLPGQSGNCKGVPKGAAGMAKYIQRLVGKDGAVLVKTMFDIMQADPKAPIPVTTQDRINAVKWLADRAFGKSVEVINLTTDNKGSGLDLSILSVETLQKRGDLLRQLKELDDTVH